MIGGLIVAGGNTAGVFEVAENALDQIAAFVGAFVVTTRVLSGQIGRDWKHDGTANVVGQRVDFGCLTAARMPMPLLKPPFCTCCGKMNFDVGGIDSHHPIRRG